MDNEIMEIWSKVINRPVLRVPGRKFPGMLLQGDTLSSLFALSRMIRERVVQFEDSELVELSEELNDELKDILYEYEQVLKANHSVLPYVSPFEH